MNPLVRIFGAGLRPPQRSRAYRPEIDGLRAVAVIAVLINHLDPRWLPGGYLGVDIFFVISGYVVTSSLLARRDGDRWLFLRRFYGRRIRRLLPALAVNVAVVSALFAMLVSPIDDFYAPVMRTGLAALFGVSNLYLLKQGSNYFATDNHYNAFLHTWSLGVEEQFYVIWPALLLLCGLGVAGAGVAALRRLKILSLLLLALSLALFLGLSLRGDGQQAFFLTTARFWELTAGCGAYLLHRGSGSARDLGERLALPRWRQPLSLLAGLSLLALLLLPENWRLATTLGITLLTAALLLLLRPATGIGRWLSHPLSLAIGTVSYSLYLWHWPVIVLARWTVGLNRLTLLPVLVVITLCTALSYRLECRFRYGHPALAALGRPGLAYPALTLLVAAFSASLQGPLLGRLFVGERRHAIGMTANMKRIAGTTVDTVHCFQEPTDPLSPAAAGDPCTATAQARLPTLFFLGDSHTHVLIPLGEKLLASGRFNVAFMARGGCPVPYFSRWGGDAEVPPRYRRCRSYAESETRRVLARLRPGDRLVLVSNLAGYLGAGTGPVGRQAEASYAAAVQQLAPQVQRRGARLVLFAPLPSFPQQRIGGPLTLCQPEWFRPAAALGSQCRPVLRPRAEELAATAPARRLQERLRRQLPATDLFDPFASICPPQWNVCSSVSGGNLLYSDDSHLTNAGALLLYPRLLAFLEAQPVGVPPPS